MLILKQIVQNLNFTYTLNLPLFSRLSCEIYQCDINHLAAATRKSSQKAWLNVLHWSNYLVAIGTRFYPIRNSEFQLITFYDDYVLQCKPFIGCKQPIHTTAIKHKDGGGRIIHAAYQKSLEETFKQHQMLMQNSSKIFS